MDSIVSMMFHTYVTCKKCNSLLLPECSTCPVCCSRVEEGVERRLYRILLRVVCANCGYLIEDISNPCPMCDAKINPDSEYEIIAAPVEL